MLPRYFHYIEPADPLNNVLDRFMHGKRLTDTDRSRLVFLSTKSKTRKAEFIYCFICQSRKRMASTGASGGQIKPGSIIDPFLTARWLRSKKVD